jgi:predicted RNA-binding protein (virulence factor B family)
MRPTMAQLGRISSLTVVRDTPQGLYLDGGALGELLLPARLVPLGLAIGEAVEVFVYRDSEDRLVATTERPRACVGEFACMRVKDLHPRAGAFLDWGLSKDLLLPFKEQRPKVEVGQDVVVAVVLDEDTDRIIATTYLDRHFSRDVPPYAAGAEVDLLIFGRGDLGYNAIVDGRFRGLLYHAGLTVPLRRGSRHRGFVTLVREDGKIDLSLDASGYERIGPLAEQVLAELERVGGRLNFDDSSSPEEIRRRFGASKKAFKQALGALYRERRIRFLEPGIQLIDGEGDRA